MRSALAVLILLLSVCPGIDADPAAAAGMPRGGKDLFFAADEPSGMAAPGAGPAIGAKTVGAYMGVSYWIELTPPSGAPQRVTTDYVFRSGDRIRLFVTTNRDGYLSLLNIGSSGRSRVLFPYAQMQPNANFVRANAPTVIPQRGTIRFDDTPGEEVLLLMLSPQPTQTAAVGGPAAPPMPPQAGYPPLPPPSGPAGYSPEQTSQVLATANAKGAKDLVVETEATGVTPATYAVAPLSSLDDGMITLRIALKHR